MSRYSGKCDFGDSWGIHGEEYILNSKIYFGDNIVPLRIDSYKDALPYFPFLVGMIAGNKEGATIRLAERSFVDAEEEEMLTWELNNFKRYYRKCKRKKIPYNVDEALEKCIYFNGDREFYRPIAEAVSKYGNSAEIPENMHLRTHEYYRKLLYKDMREAGYSCHEACTWCFGWRRWINNDLPDEIKKEFQI